MTIIADFSVPAKSFALAEALAAVPEATVEVERFAAHSREWVMPFLWASTPENGRFETALAADSTVTEARPLDRFPEVTRYEITWAESVARTVDAILNSGGTILEATGENRSWHLRVQFVDREHLTMFSEYFADEGYGYRLRRVVTPTAPRHAAYGLTPEQRATLVAAHELGYFEIPRRVTASELAAELGISQQAVSERLRRATDALVDSTIVTTGRDGI